MARFAGHVYLVQSVRDDAGASDAIAGLGNVSVIKNESTLLPIVDCVERFDYRVVANNANIGLAAARGNFYSVALVFCVNWYIPEQSFDGLLGACNKVARMGKLWDWLYRADQVRDVFFDPSARMPMIINVGINRASVKVVADSIIANGESVNFERGHYQHSIGEHIMDTQLELTIDDMREKLNDVRCYSDLSNKREEVFDWRHWRGYYVAKFASKKINWMLSGGKVGAKITAQSRQDFVGNAILSEVIRDRLT